MKALNILLLGYGKMGREIEAVALSKGHQIIGRVDDATHWGSIDIEKVDVAIDFSVPQAAMANIRKCLELNIPLVMGTTGWYEEIQEVEEEVNQKAGAFLWGSNFSLGVNILFHFNKKLAELMSQFEDYKADIHEIHHTQKLDAPSGTAITLADGLINHHSSYQSWKLIDPGQTPPNNILGISHDRLGDVKGTHIISFESEIDKISLKHEAKTRKGFAVGAVMAAEWLHGKKGFYNINDVLGF